MLGLILLRRRAQKQAAAAAQDKAYEPYHVAPYQDAFSGTPGQRGEEVKHELDHGGEEPKYEMPQPTVVEVDARGAGAGVGVEGTTGASASSVFWRLAGGPLGEGELEEPPLLLLLLPLLEEEEEELSLSEPESEDEEEPLLLEPESESESESE